MQSASCVFVVRPAYFGYNAETALSNSFQSLPANTAGLQEQALAEFDAFAQKLAAAGVFVKVFQDTDRPMKPDAVFPNNWISMHSDGTLVLYPMCTPNRRTERRTDIVEEIKRGFGVRKIMDLSGYERENRFLEGTGSVVFDHASRLAYACRSPRTDAGILEELCAAIGYEPLLFTALDEEGKEIYHTNVMMCVGDGFAVLCAESICDEVERKKIVERLTSSGHNVITISYSQMNSFAGNMLALKGRADTTLLVLSQSAFDALSVAQRTTLGHFASLLPLSIPTIETVGGGSARCMIAEIFLPPA